MDRNAATDLLVRITEGWVSDSESDVVWSGDFEGRRGVRMRQQVRDFTTVWFVVGQRTIAVEAYVLPSPPARREEVFRQCLVRNAGVRRIHFALDRDGDIVLVGRIPLAEVDEQELELALGEVYELVERSFRSLVRTAFAREKET
jgi:hypothetical protein